MNKVIIMYVYLLEKIMYILITLLFTLKMHIIPWLISEAKSKLLANLQSSDLFGWRINWIGMKRCIDCW